MFCYSEDVSSFQPNDLILKEFGTLCCSVSIQVTWGDSLPFSPIVVRSECCSVQCESCCADLLLLCHVEMHLIVSLSKSF